MSNCDKTCVSCMQRVQDVHTWLDGLDVAIGPATTTGDERRFRRQITYLKEDFKDLVDNCNVPITNKKGVSISSLIEELERNPNVPLLEILRSAIQGSIDAAKSPE